MCGKEECLNSISDDEDEEDPDGKGKAEQDMATESQPRFCKYAEYLVCYRKTFPLMRDICFCFDGLTFQVLNNLDNLLFKK